MDRGVGGAHALPRQPLSLFEAPILYPEHHSLAFSEHMFVPSRHGRAAALGGRLAGDWSTTC